MVDKIQFKKDELSAKFTVCQKCVMSEPKATNSIILYIIRELHIICVVGIGTIG